MHSYGSCVSVIDDKITSSLLDIYMQFYLLAHFNDLLVPSKILISAHSYRQTPQAGSLLLAKEYSSMDFWKINWFPCYNFLKALHRAVGSFFTGEEEGAEWMYRPLWLAEDKNLKLHWLERSKTVPKKRNLDLISDFLDFRFQIF